MGRNEIVLAPRRGFPRDRELELGLEVLTRPQVRGDQLGLLYPVQGGADLGTKIVDVNSRDYLPMCGGLTQVLGRAWGEVDLKELFDLDLPGPKGGFDLETDMGTFPILVGPEEIVTIMDPFLSLIYERGVRKGSVCGVKSYRVADFFVTFAGEIKRRYPRASFRPLDEETRGILIQLQREFEEEFSTGKENRDFAVVERREDESAAGKLLFPHNIEEGLLEASCGTGAIAVAVAFAQEGLLGEGGQLELDFESGGEETSIGGPEITRVGLELNGGRVASARLSHSLVEILSTGELYLHSADDPIGGK